MSPRTPGKCKLLYAFTICCQDISFRKECRVIFKNSYKRKSFRCHGSLILKYSWVHWVTILSFRCHGNDGITENVPNTHDSPPILDEVARLHEILRRWRHGHDQSLPHTQLPVVTTTTATLAVARCPRRRRHHVASLQHSVNRKHTQWVMWFYIAQVRSSSFRTQRLVIVVKCMKWIVVCIFLYKSPKHHISINNI